MKGGFEWIGVIVVVLLVGGFAAAPFLWLAEAEQAQRERAATIAKQTVVRTCKPPIGRRHFIVRDDQGLWFEGRAGRRRIDVATDLDEICRPAGQSLLGRLW